ncbi:MAG: hypothetical protein LIO53_05115 [Oscillospiraceae bacterium]|nr:hypothetical protein [Oscillospiraceae bacterium]
MRLLKKENNEKHTARVFQFGEGNFLRGFVDWMVDKSYLCRLFKREMELTVLDYLVHVRLKRRAVCL